MLGLAVAVFYGAGDFLGGLSAKRDRAVSVVATALACSLAALVGLVVVVRPELPAGRDVVLGAGAGAAGLAGIVLLYRGLAAGAMGVIAPVTGVGAAVLPVGWGLLRGERPSALSLLGVVAALVAVVLVTAAGKDAGRTSTVAVPPSELVLAAVAGASFGVVFILLGETDEGAGPWPLLAARLVQMVLLAAALWATGTPVLVGRGSRLTAAAAGLFDVTANGVFLLAVREGLLSLVAVLSALYPATTVLLARAVLKERLSRSQVVGLGLALAGVGLIAAG